MNKKLKEIADFIKESMCIEGTVEYIRGSTDDIPRVLISPKGEKLILEGSVFECTDKKRGTFYIGWFINSYNTYNG